MKSSSNVIDPQLYIEGGAVSLAGTTREQALHVHTLLAIVLRLLVIFCAESATIHSQQTPKVYVRHVSTSPYISSCFMVNHQLGHDILLITLLEICEGSCFQPS